MAKKAWKITVLTNVKSFTIFLAAIFVIHYEIDFVVLTFVLRHTKS